MSSAITDFEALKARLKATWTAGDFGLIAKSYEPGAIEFVERLNLSPGMSVLDVACGTGNLAFPAARAGAVVTGVDIAPNLIRQAQSRADAEGIKVKFDEGDAEQLPYAGQSFDVAISMFGVMFAPRPELVAAELLRVTRPEGRIALANWTPTGFVGQMFKTIGAHVPPPTNMPSPLKWGDEDVVRERLGSGASDLTMTRRLISFNFPFGPEEVVEFWRIYYGPTNRAFAALDENEDKERALRRDLEQLWTENNQGSDGTTHVQSEYLEVLVNRS